MRTTLRIIATVLVLTAAAKFRTVVQVSPFLSEIDPILKLPLRQALFIAALLESITGVYLIIESNTKRSGLILFSLALQFLIYRVGLFATGFRKPCHCLGEAAAWLGLSDRSADLIMRCILGIMLVTAVTAIVLPSNERKPAVA